jgi:hypothetical protein
MRARGDERSGVIEVVFKKDYGSLVLTCDDETFARICDRIVSAVEEDDIKAARVEDIRWITVGRIPKPQDITPGPFSRAIDVICLVLAGSFSTLINVVGIVVIVRWVLTRIS